MKVLRFILNLWRWFISFTEQKASIADVAALLVLLFALRHNDTLFDIFVIIVCVSYFMISLTEFKIKNK